MAVVNPEVLIRLYDHVPDVYFFVKDAKGQFLRANRALLQRLGLDREEEIVGTTDYDRYPVQVAERLVEDDRRVMEQGVPLVDHVEVLLDEVGCLDWYCTTKLPFYEEETGEAAGVVGIVRTYSGRKEFSTRHLAVDRVVDRVSRNPEGELRVGELAKEVGISERQLNRQFREVLGMSPQEFVLRSRIQAAAAVLRESNQPISEVATRFGFCDQSAFTKQFRRFLGTTPGRYR